MSDPRHSTDWRKRRARRLALAKSHSAPTTPSPLIQQVSGPPCSGKSTWIQQHAQPGDTILDDNELLAKPAGGRDRITPVMWHRWYKRLDRSIATWSGPGTLYYIQGNPRPRHPAATVTLLNPGATECHQRADRDNRPAITHTWIHQWFTKYATNGSQP